jgi:hypothetical protein
MKPKSDRQSAATQQATIVACQDIKPKSDRQSAHNATSIACQIFNLKVISNHHTNQQVSPVRI